MKVILQKDITNLGDAGDIKEVSDGYARNYLLPKKLVVPANDSSKKAMEHQERMIKIKKEKRKKQSEKVLEKINNLAIAFQVQVGEDGKLFGSITPIDIARELKEKGFEIDKRKIILDSPIKNTGDFDISVKLDEGLHASIKVTVEGIGGTPAVEEKPQPEASEVQEEPKEEPKEEPAEIKEPETTSSEA